jgi:hypothetical protein
VPVLLDCSTNLLGGKRKSSEEPEQRLVKKRAAEDMREHAPELEAMKQSASQDTREGVTIIVRDIQLPQARL